MSFKKNIKNRMNASISNICCKLFSFSKQNKNNIDDPICIIDYKETIPFVPNITSGHVIKIYDGDTITIASKLPHAESPLYRFQVRLRGIDCPEIKGDTEDEEKIALFAKKEIEKLVLQKPIILKNVGTEKYGRLLADVYINNIFINDYMIKQRLAVKYDGRKKITPVNWEKYYLTGSMF